MKLPPKLIAFCGLLTGAFLLTAPAASAALLMVDFNVDTPSPTQSGFSSAPVGTFTSTALVYTFSPYTLRTQDLTADGNASLTQSGARDRGALGGSSAGVSDLFRDFLFANSDNQQRFGLVIEGLSASTEYNLTFWAYDNNATSLQTVTVTQFGTPANTAAIGFINSAAPTSLEDNSALLTATSNASGVLSFEVFGSTNALLNGFSVDVVPEPGTALLMLSTAGFAVLCRRR